jgi:hypothetical protein
MIEYGNGLVGYIWEESGLLLRRVGIYRRFWIFFCSVHGMGIYYHILMMHKSTRIKSKL